MAINRANIVNNIVRGGKEPAMRSYHMVCLKAWSGRLVGCSYLCIRRCRGQGNPEKAGYGKNRPLPQITILYNTSELHKAIAEAIQMHG